MKKLLGVFCAAFLLVTSCQKADAPRMAAPDAEDDAEMLASTTRRICAADDVLQEQMANDPALRERMNELERFTRKTIEKGEARLVNGVLEIPVVVHVLYRTSTENISATQVESQIRVLNEDFNETNGDATKVPVEFQEEQAAVGIRFVLDRTIRKYSSKKSWGTNDDMKRTSRGGSDPVDPSQYLNMWVVNRISSGGQTILGYAQFPGGSAATDGVVIGYNYFGTTGVVSAPFDKGRTATHEVGHWMNLRHIWGDATCGNDFVGDTPSHNTANYGCPSYPHKSTCTGTPNEMTMNYMDYTDDACMFMFSEGQKSRMLAVFAAGGPRALFAQ